MKIFPAIDLWEGQVVRLKQGDFAQQTIYDADPLRVAQRFFDSGAEYLHVVDLQGARHGSSVQRELIKKLIQATPLKIQVGGGLRSDEAVEELLQAGAFRVVLGTAAAQDPSFLIRLVTRFGTKITVGMDLSYDKIMLEGWTKAAEESPQSYLKRLQELGVQSILCSDVQRDGLLQGSNRALYETLSSLYPNTIVASGGIHNEDDVKALLLLPLEGMIIGKALYSGALDLKRVFSLQKEVKSC
ncbi:MAG: 1-(5-phosphoribosyl)-5-[(5-phosphoribosylamino)methylideneamino]imidazole-4-carboxamide isomerase [Bacteroidia bacterium]|nr:1-(5-phosphoribosyl)-5-[(5-phosphoribosylamino)methylideneamino]imidazole-4-carboxamide isomerase [Bacteroidia bacterium]